jgi:hypothetical protein
MNDGMKMKGQIEVILEDKSGKVKQREVVENTITDAYLKYVLYQCMSLTNLANATRQGTGGLISADAPNKFGIYVMSEPVKVSPDTYLPPYVDESRRGLSPLVSFYNNGGTTTESSQEMIPVDARCYYDRSKLEYTLEYVKNTYAGVVRSIVIGRGHDSEPRFFVVRQKDVNMPNDLYSTTANYVLEHTADGTVIRKPIGTNEVITANPATNLYTRTVNANGFNNITAQFGALAVNGHLFKAVKKSASGETYTVTLTYLKDYLTAANTAANLDIAVPARSGMTVNTTVWPVMVSRADQNKLEIFITMSTGIHGAQVGANIKKVVVDISDINNIEYDVVDMGVIKYAISGYTANNVQNYMTGLFHDGKYYLPYHYTIYPDGSLAGQTAAGFQEGVVISADFATVHRVINFRHAQNITNCPVIADDGRVIQMQANTTTPHVVRIGQVVSGTNLENPITKGENDVLRVIYRYKIA